MQTRLQILFILLSLSGIQTALPANEVYLQHAIKEEMDGNTYTINWFASTNHSTLVSNRWPLYRANLQLSVDGCASWRTIGYGVQTPKGGREGEMVWSPPRDYGLASTNCFLRLTTMEGQPFGHKGDGHPADIPEGQYITSLQFTIAAIMVRSPAGGDIIYTSFPTTIQWDQVGAGAVVGLHWITQDNLDWTHNKIATFSNCVHGANSATISMTNVPAMPAVKLIFVSQADPQLMGYSGIISIQP